MSKSGIISLVILIVLIIVLLILGILYYFKVVKKMSDKREAHRITITPRVNQPGDKKYLTSGRSSADFTTTTGSATGSMTRSATGSATGDILFASVPALSNEAIDFILYYSDGSRTSARLTDGGKFIIDGGRAKYYRVSSDYSKVINYINSLPIDKRITCARFFMVTNLIKNYLSHKAFNLDESMVYCFSLLKGIEFVESKVDDVDYELASKFIESFKNVALLKLESLLDNSNDEECHDAYLEVYDEFNAVILNPKKRKTEYMRINKNTDVLELNDGVTEEMNTAEQNTTEMLTVGVIEDED